MRSAVASFLAFVSLFQLAVALEVTPGSACAALCLDNPESDPNDPRSSTTTPNDIVCSDDDYNTSPYGIKFQNCLDCLQSSNATSETENDTSWFLYNVRYSLDVCLYSFPNDSTTSKGVSSPCDTRFACQPVKTALEAGITNSAGDPYEYCSADGDAFTAAAADACIECLELSPSQQYLPNFITALKAGCEQKPAPGRLIGLSGSLFVSDLVNITAPPALPSSNDHDGGSSAFTTGAIVGIAVGAGLLLLGGSALFWVYHRKQKRLYSDPLDSKYDPRSGRGSVSPPLQGGLTSMGGMPPVTNYELRAHKSYNKTADYYDEFEKDMQSRQNFYGFNSNSSRSGVHATLPSHPAYVPRTHSRQASYESDTERQPRPVKSNKPDSYAIQAYLNASEEANARNMPPPPPGPPPPAAVRGSSLHVRSSSLAHDSYNPLGSHSRDSSIGSRGPSPDRRPLLSQEYHHQTTQSFLPPPPPLQEQQQTQQPQFSIPPPPPPPRAPKVPALSMPSLPKLRVPKKYAPPVIIVQDATPVEGAPSSTNRGQAQGHGEGEVPLNIKISDPLVEHPPRFQHDGFDKRRKEPPPPLSVSRSGSTERRPQWVMQEVELKTGKSAVFG